MSERSASGSLGDVLGSRASRTLVFGHGVVANAADGTGFLCWGPDRARSFLITGALRFLRGAVVAVALRCGRFGIARRTGHNRGGQGGIG